MRFYDNLFKNINIAILEGIVTFGNNEGRFCREISFYYDSFKKTEDALKKNKIIIQYRNAFETFAKIFRIIRNIDSDVSNRHKLIELIFNEYLPAIEKEYSPLNIDTYSEKANSLGLTHGKATSAFSKIAFLYKPSSYFPFDRTAREALEDFLSERGVRLNLNRSYLNYSKVINKVFNEFDHLNKVREYINKKEYLSGFNINKDLFNKRMNAFYETCAFLNIINVDDFVYRRALDKSLMIYGGFSKSNLVVFTDGIIN